MDSSVNTTFTWNFECDICEKIFSNNQQKQEHLLRAHGEKQKILCNFCSKTFSGQGSLKKHMNAIHVKQRNYECDFCKKFQSRAQKKQFHNC